MMILTLVLNHNEEKKQYLRVNYNNYLLVNFYHKWIQNEGDSIFFLNKIKIHMLHVVHKLGRKQVKLIFVMDTNNITFINNCPLFVSRSTWSKRKSTGQINQSVT